MMEAVRAAARSERRSARLQKSVGELPLVVWILLLGAFAFYQLLFLHYRPYDIDNPWSLSFSYGFSHGISTDTFMSVGFPAGQDGTFLFGKITGALQSAVCEPFGWQQRPMAVFSSIFLVLALACWAIVLRRHNVGTTTIAAFVAAAAVSDPFVSASQRFRNEPVSFFLTSAAMLMATRGSVFSALFVSMMAIETQPVAVLGLAPVVLLCWSHHRGSVGQLLTKAAMAAAAAGICELLLHPVLLHPQGLLASLRVQQHTHTAGIFSYFAQRRHLPEVLLFCLIPVLLWLRWRSGALTSMPGKQAWMPMSAAIAMLGGLLISHTNPAYIIFVYPLMIATLLMVVPGRRTHLLIAGFFAAMFLPQYAALAWLNRGQGYSAGEIRRVREEIRASAVAIGKTDADVKLLGDYGLWFAHPHEFRGNNPKFANSLGDSDLLLCFTTVAQGASRPSAAYCDDYLRLDPRMQLLRTDVLHGRTLYFYRIHPPMRATLSGTAAEWHDYTSEER